MLDISQVQIIEDLIRLDPNDVLIDNQGNPVQLPEAPDLDLDNLDGGKRRNIKSKKIKSKKNKKRTKKSKRKALKQKLKKGKKTRYSKRIYTKRNRNKKTK